MKRLRDSGNRPRSVSSRYYERQYRAESEKALKAKAEIARLTEEVERLENKRGSLQHNVVCLRKSLRVWKALQKDLSSRIIKADALAEAAEEYRYAVARSLPERIVSTGLIKLRREAATKLKAALTAWREGQREVKDAEI